MSFYPKSFTTLYLLLIACNIAYAADQPITNRFSGFASIGLVSNENSNLIFRRDVTQANGSSDGDFEWRNDSLLGLQWQTQWNYQLETTAQFILKDRVNNSLEDSLEWAFLRYRPLDGLDMRIGRLGTDVFMLSEYRQVGYALPWVRPPQETYGLLTFYHFDGVDINKRLNINDGTLNIKAFYGRSDQEYPTATGTDNNYRLVFEGAGTSINWELNEWKLRYSYANVLLHNNNPNPLSDVLLTVSPLWPDATSLAHGFETKGKRLKYNQLGAAYDNNQWFVQAEVTRLGSNAKVISSTRHFYLSAGWRWNTITLYALGSYIHTVQAPTQVTAPVGYPLDISQQLNGLAAITEQAINSSRSSQHSIGLGTRWDFTNKMALKLQSEQFYIDKNGGALWIHAHANSIPQQQTAHVVSLSLDMLF